MSTDTYRLAFGTDTESIEDPTQLVLLDLPDECGDMDSDDVTAYIREHYWELPQQYLVGQADLLVKVAEACEAEGLNADMISRIIDAAGGSRE